MKTYTLFPSFPQLQSNRERVKSALEAAGIGWRNGWGDGNLLVDCRDDADAETLRAALRENRTRDGVWPYGVREPELFGTVPTALSDL